jgi:hypothetical protein
MELTKLREMMLDDELGELLTGVPIVDEVVWSYRAYTVQKARSKGPEWSLCGAKGQEWKAGTMQARCLCVGSRQRTVEYEDEDAYNSDPVNVRRLYQHMLQSRGDAVSCGIYSYCEREIERALDEQIRGLFDRGACRGGSYGSPVGAVAACVNWGIVERWTLGYRSEFARIERLILVRPRQCEERHRQVINSQGRWACEPFVEAPHNGIVGTALANRYGVDVQEISALDLIQD